MSWNDPIIQRAFEAWAAAPAHPTVRPACYNRPPYAGQWLRNGYRASDLKPRLRWYAHRMSQECHAWDAPVGSMPQPERDGWRCDGCRLDPRKQSATLSESATVGT